MDNLVCRRESKPLVHGPLAALCLCLVLPALFVVRYLFLILGAVAFWGAGLRDGAQLYAANAVFACLVIASLFALCRHGVVVRWAGMSLGTLAALSALLPLVR